MTNSIQGKSSRWPLSQATRKRAGSTVGLLAVVAIALFVTVCGQDESRSGLSTNRSDLSGASRSAGGTDHPTWKRGNGYADVSSSSNGFGQRTGIFGDGRKEHLVNLASRVRTAAQQPRLR